MGCRPAPGVTKRASGSERVGGAERGFQGTASDAVGVSAGAKPLGFFSGEAPMSCTRLRVLTLVFGLAACGAIAVVHAQNRDAFCACQVPDGPPNPTPYLVGYLGVYKN